MSKYTFESFEEEYSLDLRDYDSNKITPKLYHSLKHNTLVFPTYRLHYRILISLTEILIIPERFLIDCLRYP